jgi:NAD-dependent SIR2 family protein deacetylase
VSSKLSLFSDFLAEYPVLAVLTGAGVSTASGIPHYRDRDGAWRHAEPIQFQDFMQSESARRRYWARSFIGWQNFSRAAPNDAHRALARLEQAGRIDTLITQNVDGLHGSAGSRSVIDLHGDLSRVRCMSCGEVFDRREWQVLLAAANPGFRASVLQFRPDGDVELELAGDAAFIVPTCELCGGIIKPDVVMFGESVPKQRVRDATAAVARADALLVVGSSLMVYSGFRFARQAVQAGKPLVIVNQGRTRADDMAGLKLDEDCGIALSALSAPGRGQGIC